MSTEYSLSSPADPELCHKGGPGGVDSSTKSKGAAVRDCLMCFAAVLVAFVFVQFLLVKGPSLHDVPIQADDYVHMNYSWKNFPFYPFRTVSFAAEGLLALAHHFRLGMIVLSVSVAYLSFETFARLFGLNKYRTAVAGIYALCLFGFEPAVLCCYYTGTVTSWLSSGFAYASILCLLLGGKSASKRIWFGAIITGCLSVLSKEDFTAPMIFAAWYLFFNRTDRKRIWLPILFSAIIGAVAVEDFIRGQMLVSGVSEYVSDYSSLSLARTVKHYVLGSPGAIAITFSQFALFCLALSAQLSKWKDLLFSQLMVLLSIAPYAVFPQHLYPYYGLNWVPWQLCPLICWAAAAASWTLIPLRLAFASLVAIAGGILFVSQPGRAELAKWYRYQTELQTNYLNTLKTLHAGVAKESLVCVCGVLQDSPWTEAGTYYLRGQLGYDCKWIMFMDPSAQCYERMRELFAANRRWNANGADKIQELLPLSELPKYAGKPLFVFQPTGLGGATRVPAAPASTEQNK